MTKARDLAGFSTGSITNTTADGLILKGDGSSTDVVIKNGANATVATVSDGSTNLSVAGSVTGALARGAIQVGNSSGVSSALAAGGAATVLTSDGTDISWAAAAESGTSLPFPKYPSNWASPNSTYTSSGTWSKGSLADDAIVWMYLCAGGQGGNSNPYAFAGGGGDVVLLCGTAGMFNGGTYTIGAGGSGLTNGTNFQPGPVGGNTTFTLSSANRSVPFTTANVFSASIDPISNADFFTTKVIYVNGAANDSSNNFMSNVGAYEFIQGTLPVTGGVTYLHWSQQGYAGGQAAAIAGFKTVFAGGNGGTNYQNYTGTPGVSLYAGQGGARGSSSSNGGDGGVPGGGGGSSYSASHAGGNGGAGNLRVYHV
jgi:hypothetical protein